MSPLTVEVVGLTEANAALRRLPEAAKIRVQVVEDTTAFHVAREASIKAPRSARGTHGHEPGFLARSIQWQSRPRSLSAVVGIARAAFYWKFLEFGTRFLSARPFVRPAADSNRLDHRRRLIAALQKASHETTHGR